MPADQFITITLPGPPRGKGRARFANGHAYTPKTTRDYESALAMTAKVRMMGRPLFDGPLEISLLATMPIPKSWSKARQRAASSGELKPIGVPDLDNFMKVCDALNGIVWPDDSSVVKATLEKRYSVEPSLTIVVRQIS